MILDDTNVSSAGQSDVKVPPFEQPPAYINGEDETGPSSPSTSNSRSLSFGSRTNFLQIRNNHDAVKGAWTIDSGFKVPEFLLVPFPPDIPERHNAYFESVHRGIDADLKVVGGHSERVKLYATTIHGHVNINLHERSGQKFYLKARSYHRDIQIKIPSDFFGVIRHKTRHRSTTFSPAVHARVATFSNTRGDCLSFLGNFEDSGYREGEAWDGDELELEAHNGRIKISFIDEQPEVKESRPSVFGKWFGSSK